MCLPLVDSVGMEEQERERRRQVVEKFQKAPFEEIAAHCGARVHQKHFTSIHIVFLADLFLVSALYYCLTCYFVPLLGHTTAEQTKSDI